MAKRKKLYAIRKGHKIGIFDQDWEIVKTYIQGYSKAEFKGFHTQIEAEHYMKGIDYQRIPSIDSAQQTSFEFQTQPVRPRAKSQENQLKHQDTSNHQPDKRRNLPSSVHLQKIELIIQGAQDTRPESILKEGCFEYWLRDLKTEKMIHVKSTGFPLANQERLVLFAMINVLKNLKRPCSLIVYTEYPNALREVLASRFSSQDKLSFDLKAKLDATCHEVQISQQRAAIVTKMNKAQQSRYKTQSHLDRYTLFNL